MNPPTHEDVQQRAKNLWSAAGGPAGRDMEFWLAAEQELSDTAGRGAAFSDEMKRETSPMTDAAEPATAAPMPSQAVLAAALQKQQARAPIVPHKTGLKAKPPETGKPLWDKPHSS